jgi:hypothetical protein
MLKLFAITVVACVGTVFVVGMDIPREEPVAVLIDVFAAGGISYVVWLIAGTMLGVNFKVSRWIYLAKRWLVTLLLTAVLALWMRDLSTGARATIDLIGLFLAFTFAGFLLWTVVLPGSKSASEESEPPPYAES